MPGLLCARSLVAAVSVASAIALASPVRAEQGAGTVEIHFVGSSTLHDFEGTAPPISIAIEARPDGTWAGEVSVPVATLDTGIGARDQKLRAMLDAAHHPVIRGLFRNVDAEAVRRSAMLPFLLRIREVERPVQARLSNWQQQDGRAAFDAAFDVSLTAFGLELPRVLFMRVDDTVHVSVHVTLKRI